MINVQSLNTVVTLANAFELASSIAVEVIGNDVADSINGTVLNSNVVRDLTAANIQSAFIAKGGSNA